MPSARRAGTPDRPPGVPAFGGGAPPAPWAVPQLCTSEPGAVCQWPSSPGRAAALSGRRCPLGPGRSPIGLPAAPRRGWALRAVVFTPGRRRSASLAFARRGHQGEEDGWQSRWERKASASSKQGRGSHRGRGPLVARPGAHRGLSLSPCRGARRCRPPGGQWPALLRCHGALPAALPAATCCAHPLFQGQCLRPGGRACPFKTAPLCVLWRGHDSALGSCPLVRSAEQHLNKETNRSFPCEASLFSAGHSGPLLWALQSPSLNRRRSRQRRGPQRVPGPERGAAL